MGDELRGENLVHLNVRFSTETELKKIQDFRVFQKQAASGYASQGHGSSAERSITRKE